MPTTLSIHPSSMARRTACRGTGNLCRTTVRRLINTRRFHPATVAVVSRRDRSRSMSFPEICLHNPNSDYGSMTVNLAPVAPTLQIPGLKAGNWLAYDPRCLRRDISWDAAQFTTTEDVTGLIKNYTNVGPFQTVMEGLFPKGYLGIHSGGHYTIGGDPGGVCPVSHSIILPPKTRSSNGR